MQKRIDILNAAKKRMKALSFGQPVTNICAGDNNPQWHSYFVGYQIKTHTNKYKVIHKTHLAKCTDQKGNFWDIDIEAIYPEHLNREKCEELFNPIHAAHFGK